MAEAPYTLTQVSEKTGISMPTLQRYKKLHQDRIPSVGTGRTQRYPEEALAVFEAIKKENLSKRGRPRKSGSKAASKTGQPAKKRATKKRAAKKKPARKRAAKKKAARKKAAPKAGGEGLLTLTEIGKRTGISYPTLVRYVKLHLDRIPHEGKGRKRRYPPEAVEVFRELRASSRRGRKKGSGSAKRKSGSAASATSAARLRSIERSQARLEKKLDRLIAKLQRPIRIV